MFSSFSMLLLRYQSEGLASAHYKYEHCVEDKISSFGYLVERCSMLIISGFWVLKSSVSAWNIPMRRRTTSLSRWERKNGWASERKVFICSITTIHEIVLNDPHFFTCSLLRRFCFSVMIDGGLFVCFLDYFCSHKEILLRRYWNLIHSMSHIRTHMFVTSIFRELESHIIPVIDYIVTYCTASLGNLPWIG